MLFVGKMLPVSRALMENQLNITADLKDKISMTNC